MIELLKRFTAPFRRYFVIGPICKLVEVIFDLMTPVVVAGMIDVGVGSRDVRVVVLYGAALAVMALIGFCFTLVCQKMASLASQGMGTQVRAALFDRINDMTYIELDQFGTPSLITRLTSDVNQVQLAVALGIRQLIRFPLLAVGSMVAALCIDVQLGLIFLVSTPLIGLVFWLVMSRCVPYFKQMQDKLDRIGLITREGLDGARVVRAFVREDHERARFRAAADDQAAIAVAVGKLSSVLNPATFLIMNLAICAILWAGGWQVNAGGLTQGEVVAFVNYMTQTLLSIVYVANLVVVFTKASASASRIIQVLGTASVKDATVAENPVSPAAFTDRAPSGPKSPAIRLDAACFSYPGSSALAVDHVTLEVPAGGTLGIIGGTGSGKSTLVSMLPRLYQASSGAVEILGRNVLDWDLGQLRHVIGLCPQRAQLVSGTIRSNLLWRDPSASDGDLWEALECARAADFVQKLPQGLDAPVEAGGKNFSGGQRQRLTIARALVGAPQVLILDDSASALDFKTDAALRAAIRERSGSPRPCTTVIVSQRVSSVRDADVICVLYHGKVAGLGTHDSLYRTCDIYREICLSQLRPEELEDQGGFAKEASDRG